MTKREIVMEIVRETRIKEIVVKDVVQKTLDEIVKALARGEGLELRNFGVFKIRERKARTGRNPKTGETVPIPPRRVVVFKPGLVMKAKASETQT